MRYQSVLAFFLFLSISQLSIANRSYDKREIIRNYFPKTEEVLTHLNNTITSPCLECSYGLAKKSDGFYLLVNEYSGDNISEVHEIQVWSLKGDFIPFDINRFLDKEKKRTETLPEFASLWGQHNRYDFMLLYGYTNWTSDVVELLSEYNNLSAEDLEILARAKHEQASQLIHPTWQYELTSPYKDGNYEQIESVRVHQFLELANQSLKHWKAIKKINANYKPMIIKDLDVKIGHDYMYYFNYLLSVKEYVHALDFLNEAWYPPAYVQYAKNMLDACSEDAILITSGDTDTFTLWYVQQKEKYRKDVTVLNSSLMQTSWYLTMCKERYQYSTSLTGEHYKNIQSKLYHGSTELPEVPYKNWIDDQVNNPSVDTNGIYALIPENFVIHYQDNNLKIQLHKGWKMMADIALLDIMVNNPDRAVLLSSIQSISHLDLMKYCVSRGYCFEIVTSIGLAMTDETTLKKLDQALDKLSLDYLKAMGYNALFHVSQLSYGISHLGRVNANESDQMAQTLINKVPYAEIIKWEDYALLDVLSSFYENMAPNLNLKFKETFSSSAMDKITAVNIVSKSLEDDIEALEKIYSIYANRTIYYKPEQTILLTKLEKKVLNHLFEKVDQLEKSPVLEHLAWTEGRIDRLKTALLDLDLK